MAGKANLRRSKRSKSRAEDSLVTIISIRLRDTSVTKYQIREAMLARAKAMGFQSAAALNCSENTDWRDVERFMDAVVSDIRCNCRPHM
ncbi:MAG: hypothetical protein MJA83_05800 [Gammaproteobacteria bacterium]|nr:hypothetical protein [Gammaproteobacteria bacterium]